jgi:phage baseplate assembly protein gpV
MQSFFGTINSVTITKNIHNIQMYACDVESLVSGELYNNCIMHFPYGSQTYPFIGQRVQVYIISDNNYICFATNTQIYQGLTPKDAVFGRLNDQVTIKFTKEDIVIGVAETTKNIIINSGSVTINSDNATIKSQTAKIESGTATITANAINLNAPQVVCSGELSAELITATSDVVGGGVSLKSHTHTSSAPGSPTSPPTS